MAFALEPEQSLELIGPPWPKVGLQPGSRGLEDADPAQNEHVLDRGMLSSTVHSFLYRESTSLSC